MNNEKNSAQKAYEGYAEATGGRTWDDKPMPTWDELPLKIQLAWERAAWAAQNALMFRMIGNEELLSPRDSLGVAAEVLGERGRQDARWGTQNHSELYWLGIIGEEFGEVAKEMIEEESAKARAELVQLAAVCLGAIESLDRQGYGRR